MSLILDKKSGKLSASYAGNMGTVVCSDDSPELLFTRTAHGLINGDVVEFTAGTLPAGISEGVKYYVIDKAADTFHVSLTAGGAAVAYTDTGTAVRIVQNLRLLGYGTFNVKKIWLKTGDAGGGAVVPSTNENFIGLIIRKEGVTHRNLVFSKDFCANGWSDYRADNAGELGEEDRLMIDFANTDANIVNIFVELE